MTDQSGVHVVRCMMCSEPAIAENKICIACNTPLTGKEPKYIAFAPYRPDPREAIKPLLTTLVVIWLLYWLTNWATLTLLGTIFFTLQCLYYLFKFFKPEKGDTKNRASLDEMLSKKR